MAIAEGGRDRCRDHRPHSGNRHQALYGFVLLSLLLDLVVELGDPALGIA
jgi:hypothetical protein